MCRYLLLCFLTLEAAAQTGRISGTLQDSLTGSPLRLATVSLHTSTGRTDGTFADSLGHFVFEAIPAGPFTLSVAGYRPEISGILDGADWSAGVVRLSPVAQTLAVVTVRGQRPAIEQRSDGFVFHPGSLPGIAGSDAADILRKIPMLSVDADGNPSLAGGRSLRVWIDGKPSETYAATVADALRAIGGENILRVEVITAPSARYDAEGTDAVIHIITKRPVQSSGIVRAMPGNRSVAAGGEWTQRLGKWVITSDLFYQRYRNRNGFVLTREAAATIRQVQETWQTGQYASGGTTVLFSPDTNRTFQVGYRLRRSPNETDAISASYGADATLPDFTRTIHTPNGNNGDSWTAGYSYRSARREWSVLGTRFRFDGTGGYSLRQQKPGNPDTEETLHTETRNRDWLLQTDYAERVSRRFRLETGLKATHRQTESDNRYLLPIPSTTGFTYRSTVLAAYASGSWSLGKWQAVTGFRLERTVWSATFDGKALTLKPFQNGIPSVSFSRDIGKGGQLKAAWTVKLQRPYFAYLNPMVVSSDSLTRQTGNPSLRPERTQAFQLSWSRTRNSLFTDFSVFVQNNRNSIEQVRRLLAGGLVESTWQNVGINRRLGFTLSSTWKPVRGLSLGLTLTLQRVSLQTPDVRNTGWMQTAVLNGSYTFGKGYSADLYGFFDGNSIRLQGYRTGWKYYSLTLTKKWKEGRYAVSLRADAFLTPYTYIEEKTRSAGFRQTVSTRYQNQNLRLTFSCRLGKKEIQTPRIREGAVD
jgi:hypothetical protein